MNNLIDKELRLTEIEETKMRKRNEDVKKNFQDYCFCSFWKDISLYCLTYPFVEIYIYSPYPPIFFLYLMNMIDIYVYKSAEIIFYNNQLQLKCQLSTKIYPFENL